jgi:hypothetical protein
MSAPVLPTDWDCKHFLVRDATIATESADTLAEERLLDATCYELEYDPNGYSCTVADVAYAFSSVHSA